MSLRCVILLFYLVTAGNAQIIGNPNNGSGSTATAIIAGIIVGLFVLFALLTLCLAFRRRRRTRSRLPAGTPSPMFGSGPWFKSRPPPQQAGPPQDLEQQQPPPPPPQRQYSTEYPAPNAPAPPPPYAPANDLAPATDNSYPPPSWPPPAHAHSNGISR